MNLAKRIFTAIICGMIAVSGISAVPLMSLNANAATLSQINANDVFVKQQRSDTCTLAANVMMLRRTALLRGDSDWDDITEDTCRATLWYGDVGMYNAYKYRNISVSHHYITDSASEELIEALKSHPEGVVAYDRDYPHAILITDYTNGVFYCADPARNVASGRIPVSQSLISVSGVDAYWYVTSPSVSLSGTGNSGTTTNPTANVVTVNEKWKVTATSGLNIRSGAGTSYSSLGVIPYNATVTVTKKTTVSGYTWGYVTYNSKSGWIALNYASKVTSSSDLTNNSTLSAATITFGKSITLKASATGGKGSYQYAYYYKRANSNSWTTIKNYSTDKTAAVTPLAATAYDVCIKVKDSTGKVESKYLTLQVNKALANNSKLSTVSAYLGKSVTLKAYASGGTGTYQYAYYYKRANSDSWTTVKNYSSDTTATITPLAATTYDVCIKVKDSSGKVESVYKTLTVKKPLTNSSKLSTASVYLGKSVTLKAYASGGTGTYQYAYYYKRANSDSWTTVKNYSSDTTATITPLAATTYDVCIKVKDSSGKVEKVYKTLTVKKPLTNSSKMSTATVTLGKSVTLKAYASGGTGSYQYAYYYKRANSDSWTTVKNYSSDTTATITPLAATTYDVCIKVKDSSGKVEKVYKTLTVKK